MKITKSFLRKLIIEQLDPQKKQSMLQDVMATVDTMIKELNEITQEDSYKALPVKKHIVDLLYKFNNLKKMMSQGIGTRDYGIKIVGEARGLIEYLEKLVTAKNTVALGKAGQEVGILQQLGSEQYGRAEFHPTGLQSLLTKIQDVYS